VQTFRSRLAKRGGVSLLDNRTAAEAEIAMLAAQDEIPPVRDVVDVDTSSVACDGDGGALGHPRVFLAIDPASGAVECPYCSRRFIYRPEGDARPSGATATGPAAS
jgi:uncharacterized Zn-finger protein